MKNRKLFIGSFSVMTILFLGMVINWFVVPFPDIVVRIIGLLLLINIVILTYNTVKIKNKKS